MKNEKLRVPKLRFKGFSGKWEEKRIEDIFDFKNGINKEKEYFGKGYPIINFTDVYHQSGMTIESIRGLVETNEKEQINYSAKKGDVFFTRTSETIHDIGMSAVLLEDIEKCVFSGFVLRARAKKDVLINLFSKYCFSIQPIRKEIVTKSSFTTRALTSGRLLNKVIFRYPLSKQEQEKIASFLSSIDKKINQLSKKDELLQNYKKAMMQKIFSQKLRFKKADGSDYPKWEEKKLGDLTKINQGLQIAISERLTNKIKGSYFYITNEFLKDNSEKKYFIKNPPPSVICTKDDILMTRTGNTGQVVTDVEGAFHNNFFKINYFKNFNKKFLVYFLNLDSTQKLILRYAGTSTIPDLNHSDFYRLKIKLPSMEEQTKIANFLYFLDTKISKNKKLLDKTQKFKKALLQKMFV